MVTTHYMHIGDVTYESVITVTPDGDVETWLNVIPPETVAAPDARPPSVEPPLLLEEPPPAPVPDEVADETALTAAPLPEAVPAAPAYTKKQRTFMGTVRAGWVIVFSMTGEGVTYAADNLAGLALPPGTGMIVGATLYGAKKAIWPDTKL